MDRHHNQHERQEKKDESNAQSTSQLQPQPPSTPRRRSLNILPATRRLLSGTKSTSNSNDEVVNPPTGDRFNRPQRMSSLHQVTMPQTPESSPISPSVNIPTSSNQSTVVQNRRITRQSFSRGGIIGSPSLSAAYFGPSSSVSSLGFESGFMPDQPQIETSSSSEEEHENDTASAFAYDSDERMSIPSRRPSMTSVQLNKSDTDDFPAVPTSRKDGPKAAIRQLYSSSKTLKPKARNFLRISRELEDEQSPMDFEIKHEAEVTQALRDEDDEPAYPPRPPPAPFALDEDYDDDDHDHISSQSRKNSFVAAISRHYHPSDTDDSDINGPASPAPSMTTPAPSTSAVLKNHAMKRKAALIEESNVDPSSMKRRAVSPGGNGMSSPIMGSPSSISTKRTNMKQMQDASEGLENMSL